MAGPFWTTRSLWLVLTFGFLALGAPSVVDDDRRDGFALASRQTPSNVDPKACAQVAPMAAAFLAKNPGEKPQVPARVAFDCLQTVPNKPEPAKKLIDSVKAWGQWQSTLAFLKTPPPDYADPPFDVMARLTDIQTRAVRGQYKNEYDFQADVISTILGAHDGHFAYKPDIFKGFQFRNNLAKDIVSVSKDGKAVPKLYSGDAIKNAVINGTSMPPAITRINGVEAIKFLSDSAAQLTQFNDLDSSWNAQLYTAAAPDQSPNVAVSSLFQVESLTLEYENGQTKTAESFALLRNGTNFTGINTGEDYYQRFCNPDNPTEFVPPPSEGPSPSKSKTPPPQIDGYPMPVVRDSGANVTAGYFLSGPGYDDVAVLVATAFGPPDDFDTLEYLQNFQVMVAEFLAKSKAAKKKRLVVDVTANGGGLVIMAFELMAQLYPDVRQFQANNLRLAPSLNQTARLLSTLPVDFSPQTPAELKISEALNNSAIIPTLVPGIVFSPEGRNLTHVDDILGPISLAGDDFTSYLFQPFNDTDPDFNLTGIGSRANPPPRLFAPENVVLLTDGTCGSTCTIFSYMLLDQLNVKTVVVGGRPQTGPMQSIAGVEGAQVFDPGDMQAVAAAALELAPADQKAALNKSELGLVADGYMLRRAANPSSAGGVNGKNAFSASNGKVPLQFLLQNANCRLFYTPEMVARPERVWERAVDATFKDPKAFCVEGSIVPVTNASSLAVDPVFREVANMPMVQMPGRPVAHMLKTYRGTTARELML